jgi:16S rRNA (cytosine1402-N4)-methyltransferase
MKEPHAPVLVNEVLEIFKDKQIRCFFDATLGAGGHAEAILTAHPEIEIYIGCDRDPDALAMAEERLKAWKGKLFLVHGNHSEVRTWMQNAKAECLDGHLIDAGVSSMQLDRPERGFSFQGEGPLDMRMNPEGKLTAAEIVNRWREEDLVKILREYGEEPRARAVARAILAARTKKKLETTRDLVEAIRPAARGKKHLHFATLTFQAIRIAVNDELGELQRGIEEGIESLCSGGRIAIISFHRLEDRISKNCLRDEEVKKRRPEGRLTILTKKPLGPSDEEVRENPRSRSAKLRAAEKS